MSGVIRLRMGWLGSMDGATGIKISCEDKGGVVLDCVGGRIERSDVSSGVVAGLVFASDGSSSSEA